MPPRYLNRQQLKRLNPFEGLIVDTQAWVDAHRYHQDQQRLHALALHGAGIIAGLEVTANASPDLSVIIHPGLAVDPEGNVILVTQAQRYYLQPKEKGLVYLIVEFREIGTQPATYDGEQPTRIVEAYRVQQRDTLPDTPYVEIARVRLETTAGPVRDARDPFAPAADEIDLRFRPQAVVRPQGEVSLGLLVPRAGSAPAGLAERGLRNLTREVSLGCGYQAAYRGPVQLGRDAGDCGLLYLGGSGSLPLDQTELAAIGAFVAAGGVLFAESAEGQGGGGFATGVRVLAERLGTKLGPVARGHPLLDTRHLFATVPTGAVSGGEVLEGGGVVLSTLDYASAWAGGRLEQPLGRTTIREALEFGVNVVAYVEARRRQVALKQPSL